MARLSMDWHRYRALPPAKRWSLKKALAQLLAARATLACIPFPRIAAWMGVLGTESPVEISECQMEAVKEISWAIQAMADRVPWDSRCLAQAIAGYRMLLKLGIPSTVYFGVKKDPGKAFNAHAWLRCGSCIVTGEAGHRDYRVLCQFSRTAVWGSKETAP